jgi:hypothetical protein
LVAGFRTVGRQFLPGDATRPTPADHFRLLDLTRYLRRSKAQPVSDVMRTAQVMRLTSAVLVEREVA